MIPRFSVVIPASATSTGLAHSIRSALRQTFADLEILVVQSDGPDGVLSGTLEACKDSRIRFLDIRGISNIAPQTIWEAALLRAKGDYVLLLRAGDVILSHVLSTLDSCLFTRDYDLAVWDGYIYSVAKSKNRWRPTLLASDAWTHLAYGLSPKRLLECCLRLGTLELLPRLWNSCVRRVLLERVVREIGGFCYSPHAAATASLVQLSLAERLLYIDMPLCIWSEREFDAAHVSRSPATQMDSSKTSVLTVLSPELEALNEAYNSLRARLPSLFGPYEFTRAREDLTHVRGIVSAFRCRRLLEYVGTEPTVCELLDDTERSLHRRRSPFAIAERIGEYRRRKILLGLTRGPGGAGPLRLQPH